ncbi:MAG TPA: hypothetical protein VMF30_00420 [Pirellulales bacterium]|nr:hypothetical protein [Pirellulales bacterium]
MATAIPQDVSFSRVPRPGPLLLANSILFAAASLFVGGVGLAMQRDWRFLAPGIGLMVFAFPGLTCGLLQYSAIFRANGAAAATLGVLLVLAAALSFAITSEGRGLSPAILGLWFGATALGAFRWCYQLWAPRPDRGPAALPLAWLGWRRPVAAWIILLAGIAFGSYEIPLEEARHVSPAAAQLDLPAGASDVNLSRSAKSGEPYFDFAVDEASFLGWVKNLPDAPEMLPIQQPVKLWRLSEGPLHTAEHEIRHGWYHLRSSRCGYGDYVDYAYDADEGRAYYTADCD